MLFRYSPSPFPSISQASSASLISSFASGFSKSFPEGSSSLTTVTFIPLEFVFSAKPSFIVDASSAFMSTTPSSKSVTFSTP